MKNVTGFDLPRLLVGSFGTLGVLTRVILRSQPTPQMAAWWQTGDDPAVVRSRVVAPSTIVWRGDAGTWVLLEGDPDDVAAQARAAGLEAGAPPEWPDAPHRGRVSVAPGRVHDVGVALGGLDGVTWLAEWGIGTVHVAAGSDAGLRAACGRHLVRRVAPARGGRPRARRLRRHAAQRRGDDASESSVRPSGQALTGPAADP